MSSSPQFQPLSLKLGVPLVNLNVREVLEKESVDSAKEISRKVNLEIEKKKEELRMLVGERYRDLIDAADTIGIMKTSSVSVYDKLINLRETFSSFPAQLVHVTAPKNFENHSRLNCEELEIASELKLSLEIPRRLNVCLDNKEILEAVHLYLFYEKYLMPSSKPFKWTFLSSNSAQGAEEVLNGMKTLILKECDDVFEDCVGSMESTAECMIIKQTLLKASCKDVVEKFLQIRVNLIKESLEKCDSTFINMLVQTLKSVYSIFIDPQLYNAAAKRIRKPKIVPTKFGFNLSTRSLDLFNSQTLSIEEPIRAAVVADLVSKHFVTGLKHVLEQCYASQHFLRDSDFMNFQDLNRYRTAMMQVLNQSNESQDLIRMVLGTSKTLWGETFYPVFLKKCKTVCSHWMENIFNFLEKDAFPRFQKLDEQMDLVSFIWKPPSVNINETTRLDSEMDLKLKLNCLTPHIAGLCLELEDKFEDLQKDFLHLGDSGFKDHISCSVISKLESFLDKSTDSLFLAKFCSAITELNTAFWSLLSTNDKTKIRQILQSRCEKCWDSWMHKILEEFSTSLNNKMCDLSPFTLANFMATAEEFSSQSESGELVKPSIHVPLQLSHSLHALLFGICVEISKVGPQSIPKSVRENFRLKLGISIEETYRNLVNTSKHFSDQVVNPLLPQVAAQLLFDLKFCQWFHSNLSEHDVLKSLLTDLQSCIDPFDLSMVLPKMQGNLKRFLFETHLTLGLLFSEESHSFIAQNFKTKHNQSIPLLKHNLSSPLPLLPI